MKNQNNTSKIQHVGVSALIRNQKGEMLIITRAQGDSHVGIWETPGGGVEWGEDPKDALVREVKEEVGLDVVIGTPVDIISYISEKAGQNRHQVTIYFEAKMIDPNQEVRLSYEHAECRWVKVEDLKSLYKSFFLEKISSNSTS